MTNKPMLSVERELLERILDSIGFGEREELRAILDNQVLESQYDGMTQAQAWAVSDGVDEILHGKPADKHNGEPVAWLIQCQHSGLVEQSEPNNKSNHPDDWSDAFPVFREQPAHAVAMTDDQILEVMRISITAADGGYVYDMSPEYVIAAGRSLLEVASLLDIKQSPVAVAMLEQLIEAIGVEQDRLFQDAERMTVEDCVKVIRQELDKPNGVNK